MMSISFFYVEHIVLMYFGIMQDGRDCFAENTKCRSISYLCPSSRISAT